jgi:colanic acid biosynthesis glycosyl transferase WcaI
VISAAMRDNLLAKGVDPRKLSLVPDWASVQDFDDVMGDEAPAGAEPNRPFTIVHAGSVAAKQKLEAVVDAMALLRDRADIRLVVIGSGNRIELFKQRAAAAKLANIEFRPTVTGKLYYESLRSADVLLLHQARDIIDVLAPSKLLTYWLSEKPVLAAVHERSQAALMIRNSRSGYVIEPERPELLAETILRMQGEPAVRLEMGRAGGAFVRREYDKRTLLPVIIQLVSEMAKHRVPVREEHMAPAANVIVPKQ